MNLFKLIRIDIPIMGVSSKHRFAILECVKAANAETLKCFCIVLWPMNILNAWTSFC